MPDIPLWIEALGLFIAALGLLFAAGAIIAGFVLYRQSSEHKKMISAFIAENRAILEAMRVEVQAQADNTLAELKVQAETAQGEHRDTINALIAKLEGPRSVRNVFGSGAAHSKAFKSSVLGSLISSSVPPAFFNTCPKCGHEFYGIPGLLDMLTCPSCGHTDAMAEFKSPSQDT